MNSHLSLGDNLAIKPRALHIPFQLLTKAAESTFISLNGPLLNTSLFNSEYNYIQNSTNCFALPAHMWMCFIVS